MERYIKVLWPDIQEYMDKSDYPKNCFFDPIANVWFIPEEWEEPEEEPEYGTKEYFDMHDCWDAIGGDWEG